MRISDRNGIKLFAGNSNIPLATEIAERIGLPLGKAIISKFSDGETRVGIEESVRGYDVFVIQSLSNPVNDNLMELLIMIDALKRGSAANVIAVIPYMGYARQDRKAHPHDPISAKVVAKMIDAAGADHVLTMDLHTLQIQGFFDVVLDHINGGGLLADYFINNIEDMSDVVAVSPDMGSTARTRRFAERLGVPMAIVDKRRPKPNVSEIMNIVGDIQGKRCILVDDMIDTGGTLANAVKGLIERGAKEVMACSTHAVLSGPAIERLESSGLSCLVVTNTIDIPDEKCRPFIKVVSCGRKFARAIEQIFTEQPINIVNEE